jgi:hypothetical protein
MVATVPAAPPEAGPDRALDPALRPAAAAEGDVAVAEDVPHAESPTTEPISTAAMIHPRLLFDSDRLTPRSGVTMVAEADESTGTVWWGLVRS